MATVQLSWLLTYISFVVDRRWTFRSIIDIAIENIHIKRQIYFLWITAVPGVYNPEYIGIRTHARHCTLCPGTGFQNINTPGSSAETAGQNIGLQPDERHTAMRNSTHFDLFSAEDLWTVQLCVYSPTPPVHRTKDDTTTALGASWPHRRCY